jgi:hypothetical protein
VAPGDRVEGARVDRYAMIKFQAAPAASNENELPLPCRGVPFATRQALPTCFLLDVECRIIVQYAGQVEAPGGEPALVEGRIEEDQVEFRILAEAKYCNASARLISTAGLHRAIRRFRAGRPALWATGSTITTRRHRASRFEAQRAAAGEEVEAVPAVSSWPSQLNSVSRTRSGVGRKPSLSGKRRTRRRWLAADDANRVQSAATVTVIRSAGRTRRANACLTSSTVTACTLAW